MRRLHATPSQFVNARPHGRRAQQGVCIAVTIPDLLRLPSSTWLRGRHEKLKTRRTTPAAPFGHDRLAHSGAVTPRGLSFGVWHPMFSVRPPETGCAGNVRLPNTYASGGDFAVAPSRASA